MRIRYDDDKNEQVLKEFTKVVISKYLFPLVLNLLIFFILFFISMTAIFRSIYEGMLSVKLYEVLMIPVMIIPLVNSLQMLIMLYLGFSKIINGNYIVNRYRVLIDGATYVQLSDGCRYPKQTISTNKKMIIGTNLDVVTIINNYSTTIWTILIPPQTPEDMTYGQQFSENIIIQRVNVEDDPENLKEVV